MSVCQGDVRNAPIENMELKNPILVEERALRQDSGGAGAFRGGLGISTTARSLVEGRWTVGSGGGRRRQSSPVWGLWGGKDGVPAETLTRLPDETEFHPPTGPARSLTPAGTTVILRSAGGGGWGDPLDRDPQQVLRDVVEGYVSTSAAREDYGVVLNDDSDAVDDAATAALRSSMR